MFEIITDPKEGGWGLRLKIVTLIALVLGLIHCLAMVRVVMCSMYIICIACVSMDKNN